MIPDKIRPILEALLGRNEALLERWWLSPNKGFNDAIPEDVWEKNPKLVIRYLLQFCDYTAT